MNLFARREKRYVSKRVWFIDQNFKQLAVKNIRLTLDLKRC